MILPSLNSSSCGLPSQPGPLVGPTPGPAHSPPMGLLMLLSRALCVPWRQEVRQALEHTYAQLQWTPLKGHLAPREHPQSGGLYLLMALLSCLPRPTSNLGRTLGGVWGLWYSPAAGNECEPWLATPTLLSLPSFSFFPSPSSFLLCLPKAPRAPCALRDPSSAPSQGPFLAPKYPASLSLACL